MSPARGIVWEFRIRAFVLGSCSVNSGGGTCGDPPLPVPMQRKAVLHDQCYRYFFPRPGSEVWRLVVADSLQLSRKQTHRQCHTLHEMNRTIHSQQLSDPSRPQHKNPTVIEPQTHEVNHKTHHTVSPSQAQHPAYSANPELRGEKDPGTSWAVSEAWEFRTRGPFGIKRGNTNGPA